MTDDPRKPQDPQNPQDGERPVQDADPAVTAGADQQPDEQPVPATPRSTQRSLASIVLGFESVVMFLATLVAFGLVKDVPGLAILTVGAVICVLLVATAGLVIRWRWGVAVGWFLQVVILATAIAVPLMIIVGAMFVAMWVYCVIRGGRIDKERAEYLAQHSLERETDR